MTNNGDLRLAKGTLNQEGEHEDAAGDPTGMKTYHCR